MRVIVSTCDSYVWVTPAFLHFYRKNWPDNPYTTEFVTETIEVPEAPTFCAGKLPWADRMITYLDSYNEDRFIFLVEDYIIREPVDTALVKRAVSLCVGDIGCVRLQPHDHQSCYLIDAGIEGFKEYPLDKPYSVSLQVSVWQKEFFLEFIRKGENIWQTETEGSKRVHASKKRVLWADTPAINYAPRGYLQKGVVDKSIEQWIKENW